MTRKNNFVIDIARPWAQWPPIDDIIKKAALLTLEEAGFASGDPVEVSIVLADDDFVRILNKQYRNKDKPTNVLSFPADEESMLGDVILAYQTVKKEAASQRKSFEHHVIHLIAHGILHLLGHDHEDELDAETMESLEIRILASFGVKNPYEPIES